MLFILLTTKSPENPNKWMASASSASSAAFSASIGPLIRNRSTRFHPCRNPHHKWSFRDVGSYSRLSLFHYSNSSPLLPSLPIRRRLILPHPPLHVVLRSRSPSFRYPLPLMASTVPDQAGPETPQSNPTKTVSIAFEFLCCLVMNSALFDFSGN